MTDLSRIEESLDPAVHLMAIADWHEERGDARLAAGYRWLARNRKAPNSIQKYLHWWLNHGDSICSGQTLPAWKRTGWSDTFTCHRDAYRWAAKHVAKLLANGKLNT